MLHNRILTEVKRLVNQYLRFFTYFLCLIGLLGLISCSSPPAGYWLAPWHVLQTLTLPTLQDGVSLWISRASSRIPAAMLLMWPGDPSMPNLRLWEANRLAAPKPLPLGIRPGQVSLYPLADNYYQILWLDQVLPGQSRFVGGTFGADREVTRGPTEIARQPVLEYAAAPTPQGDLIAVWSEVAASGTPIYATTIDSIGRPREPLLIAANGRFPSAAFSANGDLYVAWLEPGSIWTVYYAVFPSGKLKVGLNPASAGVFKLESSQIIEHFQIGIDAERVYCLWSILTINQSALSGQLAGLTFTLGDTKQTQTLDLHLPVSAGLPTDTSLRGLSLARGNATSDGLIAAVVAHSPASQQIPDRPLILSIGPKGIAAVQTVTQGIPGDGPITRLSLFVDAEGTLSLVWGVMRADGTNALYLASNR